MIDATQNRSRTLPITGGMGRRDEGATLHAVRVDGHVGRSRYAEEMRRKSCDWVHDPHLSRLARGLFLINPCDVTGERGLHIDRAVCLESRHNRCANANRGRRLPQRFRPTNWRSTVFPAKSCIRCFPQIYIFSRLTQPHGPGSSNKRFRSWLRTI